MVSGDTDRLAQIEALNQPLKHLPSEHGLISRRDVLALVEIAKAAREAANPMTRDGRAAPFMYHPANEALRAALSALDGWDGTDRVGPN